MEKNDNYKRGFEVIGKAFSTALKLQEITIVLYLQMYQYNKHQLSHVLSVDEFLQTH